MEKPVIVDMKIECCECSSSDLEIEIVQKDNKVHHSFCICRNCETRFVHKVAITERGDVEVDIYTVPF